MKINEIREKSVDELADARRSMKQEIFHLRIQQKSGQIENPARLRTLRRSIARIETVLTELEAKHAAAAKSARAAAQQ
jgi:large subunit ribosomal protein L29